MKLREKYAVHQPASFNCQIALQNINTKFLIYANHLLLLNRYQSEQVMLTGGEWSWMEQNSS